MIFVFRVLVELLISVLCDLIERWLGW